MAESNPTLEPNEPITETEIEKPQSRRRGILVAVVVVIVLVAAGIWWRSTFTEDTDDAQVNGHLIQISSRIAGQVLQFGFYDCCVVKTVSVRKGFYQLMDDTIQITSGSLDRYAWL